MPSWLESIKNSRFGQAALQGLQTASDAAEGARYLIAPGAEDLAVQRAEAGTTRDAPRWDPMGKVPANLTPRALTEQALSYVPDSAKQAFTLAKHALPGGLGMATDVLENGGSSGSMVGGIAGALGGGPLGSVAGAALGGKYGDAAKQFYDSGGVDWEQANNAGTWGAVSDAAMAGIGKAIEPALHGGSALARRLLGSGGDEALELSARGSELPPAVEWTPRLDDGELPAAREWKPKPRPPTAGQTGFDFNEPLPELPPAREWTPPAPEPLPPPKAATAEEWQAGKADAFTWDPDKPLRPNTDIPVPGTRPKRYSRITGDTPEARKEARDLLVQDRLIQAEKLFDKDAPHVSQGFVNVSNTHPRALAHVLAGKNVPARSQAIFRPSVADDVAVGSVHVTPRHAPTATKATADVYHELNHGAQTVSEGVFPSDKTYNALKKKWGYWRNPKEVGSRTTERFQPAWHGQKAEQAMLPHTRGIIRGLAEHDAKMNGVVSESLERLIQRRPKLKGVTFHADPKQTGFDFGAGADDDAFDAMIAGLQRSLR